MIILRQKQYMEYGEIWNSKKPAGKNRKFLKKLQLTGKKALRDVAIGISKEPTTAEEARKLKREVAGNPGKVIKEHVVKHPTETTLCVAGKVGKFVVKSPATSAAIVATPLPAPFTKKIVEDVPGVSHIFKGVDEKLIGNTVKFVTGKTLPEISEKIPVNEWEKAGRKVDNAGKTVIKSITGKKLFKR